VPVVPLAALGVWAVASSAPTIAVAPVVAQPRADVVVQGKGFPPSQRVAVAIDGNEAALTYTSRTGSLTAKVSVPSPIAAGDHTVNVRSDAGAANTPLVVVKPLGGRVVNVAYSSRALKGTVHASVYLPPGYATSSLRYPTVYFLHGLPADASAYSRRARPVAQLVEALGKPAIVVLPQGARDNDADPEYADWGSGRNWEHAIAVELPAYVDRHFRTIRDRTARAIVGVSAGGYGATICGLHHLQTFSVIQSWSGYFRPTDPSGTHVISLGSRRADVGANVFAAAAHLAATFAARPTSLSFYVGTNDPTFKVDNVNLDAELTRLAVPHTFRLYPGGHSWVLWDTHAEEWLGAALSQLAAPLTVPGTVKAL
jgi:S-formylglutathione hydrolase FrmB